MNRTRWLAAAVLLLLATNLTVRWWKGRGLITINCDDWPATKVIREIEKQGGITVETNLTDETKIRMHVDRVPLSEALETLATVAEGRWRLMYVFAGGLPEIKQAVMGVAAGNRPDGWKSLYMPMPPMGDEAGPADPREDVWQVKPAEKAEFQSYAQQGANSVNAVFMFPESWNPAVTKAPASGPIHKSAESLAKSAGGRVLEVFVVEKRNRQRGEDAPAGADDQNRGPRFTGGGRRDGNATATPEDEAEREKRRQAMEERAQAEIAKLPPEKRAAAQQEYDERRKFFESLRDLPQEQRREKIQEFMSSDANQNRMEARMSDQMARMTPDQRVERASKYIQRKQEAQAKTK